MRLTFLAAMLLLTATNFVHADESDDCKAIVEKAITAAGGEEKLLKMHAATWRTHGPSDWRNTGKLYGQMPDKIRFEFDREIDGKVVKTIKILNGDRGWSVRDNEVTTSTPEQVADSQATMYQKALGWTILPLRDPAHKLSFAGEMTVNEKPAVGIKVVKAGKPDVTLYFDKASGLPAKSVIVVKDRQTGNPTKQEIVYAEHKEFGGVKVPSKMHNFIDGKAGYSVDLLEFTPQGKLDEKLFLPPPDAKPAPAGAAQKSAPSGKRSKGPGKQG